MMFCLSIYSGQVYASDKKKEFAIESAYSTAQKAKKFNQNIPIYFNDKEAPLVERLFKDVTLEATSMTVLQDDAEACQKAFKDVLLSMQKQAKQLGGNAIINVHSLQDNKPTENRSMFECSLGSVVGKVVLYGEVVRLQ